MSAHEEIRHLPVQSSTNRSFGIVMAIFFSIVGLIPLRHGLDPRWPLVVLAVLFFLLAIVAPKTLKYLNFLWTQLGLALGFVMTPIVMGVMFYGVFTPIGFLMRLAGKDPLRLKFEPNAKTYWIDRSPPGPEPATLKRQF